MTMRTGPRAYPELSSPRSGESAPAESEMIASPLPPREGASAAACQARLCAILHSEQGAAQCFAKEEHAGAFADLLELHDIDPMKPGDEDSVVRFYRQHRAYLQPYKSIGFFEGRDAHGAGLIDVAVLRGKTKLVHWLLNVHLVPLTTSHPWTSEVAKFARLANRLLSETRSDDDRAEFHRLVVEGFAQGHPVAPKAVDTLVLVIDTVRDPRMQQTVFEAASRRHLIDTINRWEETPLTHACKTGKLDCVSLLIRKNADVSAKNQAGETAEDIAKAKGDGKLLATIEAAIAERNDSSLDLIDF